MTKLRAHWAFLTISVVLALAGSVQAQSTQYPDLGNRPTFSPWFGLYQKGGGPLDNYHTFVRPKVALNDTLQRQQTDIQGNSAGIDSLGEDLTHLQKHAMVRPTGTASVFMNYSHYYHAQTPGGQTTQTAAAHRRSWTAPSPTARPMH
jgi:hypothetical protein